MLTSVGGFLSSGPVSAATIPPLIINRVQVAGSEFIELYNAAGKTLDLDNYALWYFNSYDWSAASSNKLFNLSGSLAAGGFYMIVGSGPAAVCFTEMVDSASLGLKDDTGLLEVVSLKQSSSGGLLTPSAVDYVSWSGKDSRPTGTQPAPNDNQFLARRPVDKNGRPVVTSAGGGSWQVMAPDSSNPCASSAVTAAPISGSVSTPSTENSANTSNTVTANIGLTTPQISELLPNPAPPQTDDQDEYIELYNPNDATFNLSGYRLQTGTTTVHNFTFPSGTVLKPKTYTAFLSSFTNLSLSNSGGQASLLDLNGKVISQSDPYGTAKDGLAWALVGDKWQWTADPTPSEANKSVNVAGSTDNGSGKVKGASTGNSNSNPTTAPASGGIHPLILAGIGGAALLYALYEYRNDLANQIYRFRRNRKAGRAIGQAAEPSGSRRITL